jgi:hypothetical protein
MPTTSQNIQSQYRESAIQDMLGRPPGWLLRSGLSVLALALIVVFGLAALIQYPERVEGAFVLQTKTMPLRVDAGVSKYVDALLIPDGEAVTVGDTLLIFRSDGDWEAIAPLRKWLAKAETSLAGRPENIGRPPDLDFPSGPDQVVGELISTILAYESYRRTNGTPDQVAGLKREIAETHELSQSLNRQVALYDRELGFQKLKIERSRNMEAQGLISKQEAEDAEGARLVANRQREVLVAGDVQNRLRSNQLRQQILQLRLDHRERSAAFVRQLNQELQSLHSALDRYELDHFIVARESGTIDWQPEVRKDALIAAGTTLGYLVPSNKESTVIVARLLLPAAGAGRAEVGNTVILELDAYPAREFGQLRGELVDIDAVAIPDEEQGYVRRATVAMADSLVTTYGERLPFQYNLTGAARIITRDRTLLQRLFDQFLNLSKNQ